MKIKEEGNYLIIRVCDLPTIYLTVKQTEIPYIIEYTDEILGILKVEWFN